MLTETARLIASSRDLASPCAILTIMRFWQISGSNPEWNLSRRSMSDDPERSPMSLNTCEYSTTLCPLLCFRPLITSRASIPGSMDSNLSLNASTKLFHAPLKGFVPWLKLSKYGVAQSPAVPEKKPRATLIHLASLFFKSGCSVAQLVK